MTYSIPLPLRAGILFYLCFVSAFSAEPAAPPARIASSPAELTVEDFFRPPTVVSGHLSPAGTHLALLVHESKTDSTGLRILDIATKRAVGLTGTRLYDVRDFHWVGNERVVFTVTRDNIYATGLFSSHRDLVRPPIVLNERDAVQVLGSPEARPDHLFVWVRQTARDSGRPGRLVEINIRRRADRGFDEDSTMIVSTINDPPGEGVRGWLTDRDGEIRYAVTHKDGHVALSRRDTSKTWTQLAMNLDEVYPLAVDANPDVLLVARLKPDGLRELMRLNTRDGSSGPVLHTDEKYDFRDGRLRFSSITKELISLRYSRQGPTDIPFTAEESRVQRSIDAALPAERINQIVSRSRDGFRLLVRSLSDRHPGHLYFYAIDGQKATFNTVANLAPWLPESLLGPVRLMTYKTRDGLQLDAYVTLPVDHVAGKPAPMIVLPHGGPWVRDSWGYDAESQFFASRGYIVFRPNYRGSSGYHADISLKPRMEFRKMHDDVTDGVRALIKSGIADPAHIAIIGGSFGGYLAVCGAAFEPDLYKCAVTIAGVFDWDRAMREARRNDPDSYRYERLLRELGNPKEQQEKFEALSPLQSADQIRIPVFIAHGGEDRIADSNQSHRLVRILKKANVPHETMFESQEGHGFLTLKNRVELYERIEAFLKKHI